jgi:hypothetical protein
MTDYGVFAFCSERHHRGIVFKFFTLQLNMALASGATIADFPKQIDGNWARNRTSVQNLQKIIFLLKLGVWSPNTPSWIDRVSGSLDD